MCFLINALMSIKFSDSKRFPVHPNTILSCLTSIAAVSHALERGVVGRITAVVHAVRLRRGEMLEEVNIATRDGILVASRGAVILDRDGKVAGAKERTERNNFDDSTIGHPDS